MANMFSNRPYERIPKSLTECTEPNETANELHLWSGKVEKWGQILFYILLAVGLISAILATIEIADINEEMAFSTFISTAITWSLYAFIEYCAYHVLALLINALASIVQHTAVTANVAVYEAANTISKDEVQNMKVGFNPIEPWRCKHCDTLNGAAADKCMRCGQSKK